MSDIRYTAQRFGTNEWLSLNLPLTTDGPWETYNGYETMEASISPEVGNAIAEDGRKVIEKWGTWIHAESPDERLWTGIVDDVVVDGDTLTLQVRDWVGYLDGMTLRSRVWGVNSDPADLVRGIWTQLQSFPNGNLGVTVKGSTPVRLGSSSEDAAIARKATMKAAKRALDAHNRKITAKEAEIKKVSAPQDKALRILERDRQALTRTYERAVFNKRPKPEITAAKAAVDQKTAQISAKREERDAVIGWRKFQLEDLQLAGAPLRAAYETAETAYKAAQEKVDADGGAWKVLPEDLPDAWTVLQDLADEAPFDFVASTTRTTGAPQLSLEIFYPSIGSVRDDLIFEQGWNISYVASVEEPDKFASELIATGAGQGEGDEQTTLRTIVAEDDKRMRRTTTFSDPAITKLSVLQARAKKELANYRTDVIIPEIRVFETPNTPIGSWRAGDIVQIKLHDVPHYGRVEVKHRIKSWQRNGESEATLRLEPVLVR